MSARSFAGNCPVEQALDDLAALGLFQVRIGLHGHPEPGQQRIAPSFQGLHRGFAPRAGFQVIGQLIFMLQGQLSPGISLEVFVARTSRYWHDVGLPVSLNNLVIGLY